MPTLIGPIAQLVSSGMLITLGSGVQVSLGPRTLFSSSVVRAVASHKGRRFESDLNNDKIEYGFRSSVVERLHDRLVVFGSNPNKVVL